MTTGIPDFSRKKKDPPQFRMEDDVFIGVSALPALALMETAIKASSLGNLADDNTAEVVAGVFGILLEPDSAHRFIGRLHGRTPHGQTPAPIDSEQMNQALTYLMEYHGMRPTQPSSDSSDGSPTPPDAGTSSTVSVPPAGSTSGDFPQISSSTSSITASSAA